MRHQHQRPKAPLARLKPRTTPGMLKRHIIAEGKDERREYELHATKGYRSYRGAR